MFFIRFHRKNGVTNPEQAVNISCRSGELRQKPTLTTQGEGGIIKE